MVSLVNKTLFDGNTTVDVRNGGRRDSDLSAAVPINDTGFFFAEFLHLEMEILSSIVLFNDNDTSNRNTDFQCFMGNLNFGPVTVFSELREDNNQTNRLGDLGDTVTFQEQTTETIDPGQLKVGTLQVPPPRSSTSEATPVKRGVYIDTGMTYQAGLTHNSTDVRYEGDQTIDVRIKLNAVGREI